MEQQKNCMRWPEFFRRICSTPNCEVRVGCKQGSILLLPLVVEANMTHFHYHISLLTPRAALAGCLGGVLYRCDCSPVERKYRQRPFFAPFPLLISRVGVSGKKDLYEYWKEDITRNLLRDVSEDPNGPSSGGFLVVNVASQEVRPCRRQPVLVLGGEERAASCLHKKAIANRAYPGKRRTC